MNSSDNEKRANRSSQICPFLGLSDDPATALSFPSTTNHCYHARPDQPVNLLFQRSYCLAAKYLKCEEYNRQPYGSLPSALRYKGKSSLREIISTKPVFWVLAIALPVLLLIVWLILSGGRSPAGSSSHSPVAMQPTVSTALGLQPTASPTVPAQNTPTPTLPVVVLAPSLVPTMSPTLRAPHAIGTPVGSEHKFVIHQVQPGESLISIANRYWTTVEAINAVNFNLQVPILVDSLIVVPVDQADPQGLPVFKPYKVKTDIAVETLAQQESSDPELLKLYNTIPDGEILKAGDWVIIPYTGTASPK